MNQELRERAEKYAEPVQSVCRGQAYALERAYLAGAKDQAERDAKLAEGYVMSDGDHCTEVARLIRASVEG